MSKKRVLISILLIMAVAAFLRLWDIKSAPPGLYPDEAMNGNNGLEALQTGNWKWFYPENNGREALFINIQAVSVAIFGNEPWALRLVSALVGIFTVLGLFFLTKELFPGKTTALFASFFLAASFWHLVFSRIGFRAIMAPFFLVWSFYFLWKLVRKTDFFSPASIDKNINEPVANPKEKKSVFLSAIIGGLLFGLGFHTYISFRVAPILLIPPFIILWRNRQKKIIALFLIFAFLAALPLGIYFLKNPADFMGRTSQLSVMSAASPLKALLKNIAKTAGMFLVAGDYNWRHNFSGSPELWWPVAILFITGIVFSFWLLLKNFKPEAGQRFIEKLKIKNLITVLSSVESFLFIWIVVMLLPVVISNEGIPHALRSIVAVPVAMIFAGIGMAWVISKISDRLDKNLTEYPENAQKLSRFKKELFVFLMVFLLAIAVNAFDKYFFLWSSNPYTLDAYNENYVELGRYINTLPTDIPKYVVVNANGVLARGVKMPAQTVMFITKTWLPEWQSQKNLFYVDPADLGSLAQTLNKKDNFYIMPLEKDFSLDTTLKNKFPGLVIDTGSGNVIFYKLKK